VELYLRKGLYYLGEEMFVGTKYTMGADILYKLFRPSGPVRRVERR